MENSLCNVCRYPLNVCKCIDDELEGNIEPTHYTQFNIPPNVYITENNLEWEEGNIVKYVTRHRFKNGKEDLLKARKYIDLLIKRMY